MTLALFAIVLIELLLVAAIDLKTQKISNYWVLINLLLAITLYLFSLGSYSFQLEIFYFPLGFIVVGFILFLLDIMGAGDSKFLASLFLILPFSLHSIFFEKILISTISVGSILFIYRILKNLKLIKIYLLSRHWIGIRSLIKSRFSYAPVILLAWILLGAEKWP